VKNALRWLGMTSILLVSTAAWADAPGEGGASGGVRVLPEITIYGRVALPHVVIELPRPSAARAAGEAHDDMRERWLEASEPAALRDLRR
jgi:hypothetical protein